MNNTEPETTELVTNLTLGDLKLLTSLIDACAVKGLLRATELTLVGCVYDKINSILASAGAK
jgi:hypothetical protein